MAFTNRRDAHSNAKTTDFTKSSPVTMLRNSSEFVAIVCQVLCQTDHLAYMAYVPKRLIAWPFLLSFCLINETVRYLA